jgi:hypothetical protein
MARLSHFVVEPRRIPSSGTEILDLLVHSALLLSGDGVAFGVDRPKPNLHATSADTCGSRAERGFDMNLAVFHNVRGIVVAHR